MHLSKPLLGRNNHSEGIVDTSIEERLLKRADLYFYVGCMVCGTWVLGLIGAPILLYGMYLMRKAQLQGAAIRPWSITIVGGLILMDASVNYLAWGLDLFPSHYSVLARTLWINYGMLGDGAYALHYNSTVMGGVALPFEKSVQIGSVIMIQPIRAVAAWGLLHMKRWGLQWSIIGNWMYMLMWVVYGAYFSLDFQARFGTSEFGVIGFWLMGGIPFLGPLVLLPYLHTVNRKLWAE